MRSGDIESLWWEEPRTQKLPNLKADESAPPPADQPKTEDKAEKNKPKGKGGK